MKIIADFIPNHTSDQHWWFRESRSSRTNPYRDYYVWSDTDTKYKEARIIFVDTQKSNWTWDENTKQYYWHRFYSCQPDLNYENPKVREEMMNVMRFWLDMGIDGFRVDAVPYLFEQDGTSCENLDITHEYLKEIRMMIDTEYPDRILLAEACQMPQDVRAYFGDGDEFHMGFHFPVMPRIYMSIKAGDCTSLRDILEITPEIPDNCQWVTFLRNHDELTLEMVTPEERKWMWEQYAPDMRMRINLGIRRRLAPLMDNDRRRIELAHSMLLTLPGSPILYYGDEICMGDNIDLPDRNGVRTPMQWDNSKPWAGFSMAKQIYSPMVNSEKYGPWKVNVRDAQNEPSSFYNILKHLIHTRRKHQAFGSGKLVWLENVSYLSSDNDAALNAKEAEKSQWRKRNVASWIRHYGMDIMLVVANVSQDCRVVQVPIPRKMLVTAEETVRDILSGERFPVVRKCPPEVASAVGIDVFSSKSDWFEISLQLNAFEYRWIELSHISPFLANDYSF